MSMQMIVTVPTVPTDLRALLTDYLEEQDDMTEAEDRIMSALRDNYVTRRETDAIRSDIGEVKELVAHIKDGNGSPGLYAMDKRLDRIEQRAEPMQRIKMHVVTATITLVLGAIGAWALSNKTAAPVKNEVAADQIEMKALHEEVRATKEVLDRLIQRMPTNQKSVTQSGPQTVERRPGRRQPAKEIPKGHSMLRGREMIVGDIPGISYSSARISSLPRKENP